MAKARRALILGLDAMVPNTAERFLTEGILPNLARLAARGSMSRARSCGSNASPPSTSCASALCTENWGDEGTIQRMNRSGGHGPQRWGDDWPPPGHPCR